MTQEEKELITKTLCEGMFYRIKVNISASMEYDNFIPSINDATIRALDLSNEICNFKEFYWDKKIVNVRPYLRSLLNMTEEEILELYKIAYTTWYSDSLYYKYEEWITFRDSIQNNALCFKSSIWLSDTNKVIDWLKAHHFDYRDLIPMGLALEAPEGMYDTKTLKPNNYENNYN